MPGNGLSLAVGVGCHDQAIVGLQGGGDVREALRRLSVDFPIHLEIGIGSHRAILGRQVADRAIGGQDDEILAQILVDGLGLGR